MFRYIIIIIYEVPTAGGRYLQARLTTDQYLQCYCRRKTLATGRYLTYIPEKVNLREATPYSAPSQKVLCSSFPQNFSVQS